MQRNKKKSRLILSTFSQTCHITRLRSLQSLHFFFTSLLFHFDGLWWWCCGRNVCASNQWPYNQFQLWVRRMSELLMSGRCVGFGIVCMHRRWYDVWHVLTRAARAPDISTVAADVVFARCHRHQLHKFLSHKCHGILSIQTRFLITYKQ